VTGAAPAATRQLHFFRDFLRLAGPWWTGPERWVAAALTALLLALGIGQVLLAIRLNLWLADFFDALERRSFDRFLHQAGILALLVLGTMAANAAHLVVKRRMQLRWRRFLTERVVGAWMDRALHYQVALMPGDHDNPDGRIAEDVRIAIESAVDLAQTLFYAVLLLVSFVGILWSLSGLVHFAGADVPGHLVMLALLYAAGGSLVAWLLGRPLVGATDARQTREADFRFGLVRARETGAPIALARGEKAERGRLARLFDRILPAWGAQTEGLGRLIFFSSGYTMLAPIFPLLVATPRYIGGALTLGEMMQSAQAFQQVAAALSWPVDNLQRIAEWRASVERVLVLAEALGQAEAEVTATAESSIAIERADDAPIRTDGLDVAAPDGTAILAAVSLDLRPGERVLVEGEQDAAMTLFRVLAGVWPWGRGTLLLPPEQAIAAVGERPYLTDTTLRAALIFPAEDAAFAEADLVAALSRVGLDHLASRLLDQADWTSVLSPGEAQRLSVARLLLHRPRWVLMGDALDALDTAAVAGLLSTLREAMPEAAVVVLGRHPGSPEWFDRRLTLERDVSGQVLLHEVRARREAARMPRRRPLPVVDWLRRGYGFYDRD